MSGLFVAGVGLLVLALDAVSAIDAPTAALIGFALLLGGLIVYGLDRMRSSGRQGHAGSEEGR